MVVTLTFKTPDVMDCIDVDEEDENSPTKEQIREKLSKWVEYSEYVKIEFDLDKMEAKVITRK